MSSKFDVVHEAKILKHAFTVMNVYNFAVLAIVLNKANNLKCSFAVYLFIFL